jgi:hypothetical protein
MPERARPAVESGETACHPVDLHKGYRTASRGSPSAATGRVGRCPLTRHDRAQPGRRDGRKPPLLLWVSAMTIASFAVACLALITSALVAIGNMRFRRRQEAAALTAELYAALRGARDAAFQVGKPLGGGLPEQILSFRSALVDLSDLRPTIHDPDLRTLVDRIFDHHAVGFVSLIDPDRFVSLAIPDETYVTFLDCGRDCASAVERCQVLRRGIG